MPDAQQLLDEWTSGETNGMRPARVQAVRDDLMEATGEYIPRRISEIEATLLDIPQRRGVVTRKLRAAAGEDTQSGETAEGSDSADSDSAE